MGLIIQKFGGTSVGSIERIRHVAQIVKKTQEEGHQIIVVVSAMAGETDKLINLAKAVSLQADAREYDLLLSAGEQVTIALLAMALIDLGCSARSYTGGQAGILTDARHKKARILGIGLQALQESLQAGVIPIVAGFQGADASGEMTTFGRGGSDITAVALAARFRADECQIFTDVEGVLTVDPNLVPEARRLEKLSFDEILELSSLGSQVIQFRAVEFAKKYAVPVRVLSSFKSGEGTLISEGMEKNMEQPRISGIAFDVKQMKLLIRGLQGGHDSMIRLLEALHAADVDIDMMIQNTLNDDELVDFSFTVHKEDYQTALSTVESLLQVLGTGELILDHAKIAKVSIVGVGVCCPQVLSHVLRTLACAGIKAHLICTTKIKIAFLISENHLLEAVRLLHEALALNDRETIPFS